MAASTVYSNGKSEKILATMNSISASTSNDIKTIKNDIKDLGEKLDGDVKELTTKVDGDIKELTKKVDGDIKELTKKVDGDINELSTKVVELSTKVVGIDVVYSENRLPLHH